MTLSAFMTLLKMRGLIKIKGVDLLILDKINGNPFVVAIDLGIETKFDETSNNYNRSVIEKKQIIR